jgi:hypothetical protein
VYTNRHGWLWVSDEPFGWAVYHYGRWGWANDIGWYWVPGTRWAPAWVAWHRTDEDVAWAPLPPDWDDDDDDIDIDVAFYQSAPIQYWQVVPVNFFLSIDIHEHIIRDRDHIRRVIREGDPEVVHIENNIVVNNVIDVDFIEKHTDKEVVVHEVKAAEDPEAAGKTDEDTVAVFDPEVKKEDDVKPADTKKVEEVAKERAALAPEEAEGEQAEGAAEGETPAATQSKDAATGEQPAEEQPIKKKAKTEAEATGEAEVEAEAQPTEEQPVKKKAKKAVEATGEAEVETEAQPTEEQPVKKKAKKEAEPGEKQPETKAAEQPPEECVGEDCPQPN